MKQTTNGRGDRLKNVYRCSVDMKDIWNIEPLDAAFEMLTRIIPNADNPHHDEIMDKIKEVYGKGNENT